MSSGTLQYWATVDTAPFTFGPPAKREERGGFRAFVARHNPTLLDYEHVPRLIDVAERVVSGELKRVMVLLPPRYFKSEIFSRLLPAYYLRRHPTRHVGLASYGAALAWELSEEARNYFEGDGGQVSSETAAKRRWRSTHDGEMWADGVGGALLGRGYHLGIVDDPSDPQQAHSPTYQRRFEDWWPSKFISRQEPGAAIVVVMQRLGTQDPIDFLFRREVGEDADLAPEDWHVVVCDEVKSDGPLGRWDGHMGLPATCTVEPDPRKRGEVLAPSRFDTEQVKALQQAAGTYVTASQRQARPAAPQGDFWKREWFTIIDAIPPDAYNRAKDWDTAYTKDERNSASAYIESYRGPGPANAFPIYISDCDWEWYEFPELVNWMRKLDGPHHIEQKATGKSAAQSLRREGVAVTEVSVKGDKLARSANVQPIVSNKRVFVLRSCARKLLEGERQGLLRVTAESLQKDGADLDLNDTFVQALHRHTSGPQLGSLGEGALSGLTRESPNRIG